jgi:hypothetical protein
MIDSNKLDVAAAFVNTARFVDDLLNLDNPHFAKYLHLNADGKTGGIYPKYLKINLEQTGFPLHFLDVTIIMEKNRFWTTLHDKRNDPKYVKAPMLRYQHFSTHLPENTLYNTVTGQMHRYEGICQRKHDFLLLAALLTLELFNKDYAIHKIYSRIRTFINKSTPIYHSIDTDAMLNEIKRLVRLIQTLHLKHPY